MKQLTRKILALLLCAVLLLGMTACTQTPNEPTEKENEQTPTVSEDQNSENTPAASENESKRGMIRSLSRSRLLKHSVCLQS
mgnify:CR=1 FL=1